MAVLKARVKDKDGATPDMQRREVVMGVEFGTREEFDGGETGGSRREVVPDVDGVLHGKGPKADVRVFRPMQCGVNEHGAGPFGDSTNSTLGHPILVVGSDTRKGLLLVFLPDIGEPFVAGEDAIVAMIFLDGDTHGRGGALEDGFALDAFSSAKGDLWSKEDIPACMIDADETAGEFLDVILASAGLWETPFCAADEVVDGDAVAWA